MRKTRHLLRGIVAFLLLAGEIAASAQNSAQNNAEARITKQVRSRILKLPNFGVYDNITFSVNGNDVTLLGQVRRPTLKTDAERAVKTVEGVERVNNQIEVLPVSTNDDRLRHRLYMAIYRYAPLHRYGVGSNRPIRIIVKNGNVTLEGVVDSEADKNMVGIRANSVPGIFSVKNNLNVAGKGTEA